MASKPAPRKAPPKASPKPAALKKAAGAAASAKAKVTPASHAYDMSIADEVLDGIAAGGSLREVCGKPGLPSVTTFMRWLADERNENLRERYARARELQAEYMAEDILSIADEECTMVKADKHGSQDDDGQGNTEVVFDSTAVQRNRLRVDARKWLLSKLAPKKYGDKVAIGGADDLGPVQTVTKEMTDAERAVRLARAINDNPAAMQALVAALGKKAAAK